MLSPLALLAGLVLCPAALASAAPDPSPTEDLSQCVEPPIPAAASTPAGPGSRSRTPSFYLSIKQFKRRSASEPWSIVDIRAEKAYKALRIPGSLRIQTSFLKAAGILKGKNALLVNEGHNFLELENLLPRLAEAGALQFKILDGGLNRWASEMEGTQSALIGDKRARDGLSRMPAMDFVAEAIFSNWLVVDTTAAKAGGAPAADEKPLPDAKPVPFTGNAAAFAGRLAALVRTKGEKQPLLTVLIADQDPKRYDAIRAALKNAPVRNVFYLEGGRSAYAAAIKQRDQMVVAAREYAKNQPQNRCNR